MIGSKIILPHSGSFKKTTRREQIISPSLFSIQGSDVLKTSLKTIFLGLGLVQSGFGLDLDLGRS